MTGMVTGVNCILMLITYIDDGSEGLALAYNMWFMIE